MKVVLVALYDVHSFGVRSLHATLESRGFDVHTVFFHGTTYVDHLWCAEEIETLVATIASLQPDLVGISVRSPLFPLFQQLTPRLRAVSEAIILAGGHHATVRPRECLDYADAVCVGEGEGALLDVCELLETQNDLGALASIANIVTRTSNGIVVANPLRPLRRELDMDPDEIYSKRQIYLYCSPGFESEERMAVLTTRGCFFSCTFCYNQSMKQLCRGLGRYVRRRTVTNVIEEIQMLKRRFAALREISFADNVFTFDREWIAEFCEQYKAIELPFRCFSHFSLLKRDMLHQLVDAGCRMITVGIQSGAERLRRQVLNRHETNAQIVAGSKILAGLGISIRYDLIDGIPVESPMDLAETATLIRCLQPPYSLRRFRMRHFPGSRLTETLLEGGFITEKDVEGHCETTFGNWFESQACDDVAGSHPPSVVSLDPMPGRLPYRCAV